MSLSIAIIISLPGCLSLVVSGIYAYIALKKVKEPPKDEIWETATKLVSGCSPQGMAADDFAITYMELKFFRDNGYTLDGAVSIHAAMQKKKQSPRSE